MRVKLLISRAGPGVVYGAGDEIEVSAAEAKRLCEAGKAEPVREAPPPERAVRRTTRRK